MSQFKSIDEAIYTIDGTNIVPRKKNPTASIIVTLIGAAILVVAYLPGVHAQKGLASGILIAGIFVALAGLFMLVLNVTHKGTPFHIPSGEHLRRRQRSFDHNVKEQVVKLLTEGNFDAIAQMPEGETGAIIATTYRSHSGKLSYGQVLEFVPHYYVPITDIMVFKK